MDRYSLDIQIITDAEQAVVLKAVYALMEQFYGHPELGEVLSFVRGPDGHVCAEFRPTEGEDIDVEDE